MKYLFIFFLSSASFFASAQSNPVITSWWINTDSAMVGGVLAGVHRVDYTGTNVYITTAGIPEYYVSGQSINNAGGQNWVFRMPLDPQEQTGTKSAVPFGGPVGLLVDGSVIFGPLDAMTWNNGGVWHRIAYLFEGTDFDSTNGHSTPGPGNVYHHHVDPIVLHNFNNQAHSPLIGFAFDGFPIYGPFGYVNPDGSGGVKLMAPSYQLRGISDRQTLPDGTVNPGPAISTQYPLGCFQEDYEFIAGAGELDEYNGRFTVTPEYPGGIYAYFATIDNLLQPVYPYFLGLSYYGVLDNSNTGPNGGQNNVPGTATQYIPDTTAVGAIEFPENDFYPSPNPARNYLQLHMKSAENIHARVISMTGKVIINKNLGAESAVLDISVLHPGIYVLQFLTSKGNPVLSSTFVKE